MELELKTLFGLPAHPLVVHGAVVLVPLAALVTVLVVLVPRWRPTLAVVAGLAVAAFVVVWLATGSGDALEHQVDKTELVHEHAEMGEQLLPIVGIAGAATIGVAVIERLRRRGRSVATGVVVVLSVLAVGGAVVETVQVVRTGHAGARATWDDLDEERG